MPTEGSGNDQSDDADEFENAKSHPGSSGQRTKGWHVLAYLFEHEHLHDARSCVKKCGEDLQDPQHHIHRVFLPGFIGRRQSVRSSAARTAAESIVEHLEERQKRTSNNGAANVHVRKLRAANGRTASRGAPFAPSRKWPRKRRDASRAGDAAGGSAAGNCYGGPSASRTS